MLYVSPPVFKMAVVFICKDYSKQKKKMVSVVIFTIRAVEYFGCGCYAQTLPSLSPSFHGLTEVFSSYMGVVFMLLFGAVSYSVHTLIPVKEMNNDIFLTHLSLFLRVVLTEHRSQVKRKIRSVSVT